MVVSMPPRTCPRFCPLLRKSGDGIIVVIATNSCNAREPACDACSHAVAAMIAPACAALSPARVPDTA
jgi:hypothetical protein